jgi:adenylosuccinate synthase
VYESVPGWTSSTSGVTEYEDLPPEARAYLRRIEEIVEVPVDVISTGPSREAVIIRRHPFAE